MKAIRNLLARLLRHPAMPTTPAAVESQRPPVRRVSPRAWALASVPRRRHAAPAAAAPVADEGVSPMHAAVLMSLLSTEDHSADAGSFGTGWDIPATFE